MRTGRTMQFRNTTSNSVEQLINLRFARFSASFTSFQIKCAKLSKWNVQKENCQCCRLKIRPFFRSAFLCFFRSLHLNRFWVHFVGLAIKKAFHPGECFLLNLISLVFANFRSPPDGYRRLSTPAIWSGFLLALLVVKSICLVSTNWKRRFSPQRYRFHNFNQIENHKCWWTLKAIRFHEIGYCHRMLIYLCARWYTLECTKNEPIRRKIIIHIWLRVEKKVFKAFKMNYVRGSITGSVATRHNAAARSLHFLLWFASCERCSERW